MAHLSLLTGPTAGQRHTLGAEATLGRSPTCEIPLDDAKASRRHAQVVVVPGRVVLRDLGSRNGTFLNGEKVDGERELAPGDRIQIGETVVRFEDAEEAPVEISAAPLAQLLPQDGPERALLELAEGLLGANDRAQARDQLTSWLARQKLAAQVLSVDESHGLPRALVRPALVEGQLALGDGKAVAPIRGPGGEALGVIALAKESAFNVVEQRTLAAAAHLAGRTMGQLADGAGGTDPLSPGLKPIADEARERLAREGRLLLSGEEGVGKTLLARALIAELAGGQVWEELEAAEPTALQRFEGSNAPLWLLQRADLCPAELASQVVARLKSGAVKLVATSAAGRPLPVALAAELEARTRRIPPLRERPEDIAYLFDRFVDRSARRRRQLPCRLSPEARRALLDLPLSKNGSELRLIAEHLQLLHPGVELSPAQLSPGGNGAVSRAGNLDARIAEVERVAIAQALREARGKKVKAAALLGISRPTLDKKIAEYGLRVEKGAR